jgi:hypothetical protein
MFMFCQMVSVPVVKAPITSAILTTTIDKLIDLSSSYSSLFNLITDATSIAGANKNTNGIRSTPESTANADSGNLSEMKISKNVVSEVSPEKK